MSQGEFRFESGLRCGSVLSPRCKADSSLKSLRSPSSFLEVRVKFCVADVQVQVSESLECDSESSVKSMTQR